MALKHARIPAVLLACLILLCGACTSSAPSMARLAPDAVILAFGDSLTYGTGANADESYPSVLAQLTGRTVINAGVPGEISAAGAQRLEAALDEHQPQLLILCHGGNDLLRRLDRDATVANLRAMIGAAKSRGIAVVLIGVPEPKLFNRDSAPYYAELAAEFGLPIENEVLAEVTADNDQKSDGIHPNARGYRRMAEAIHALLQRSGAL